MIAIVILRNIHKPPSSAISNKNEWWRLNVTLAYPMKFDRYNVGMAWIVKLSDLTLANKPLNVCMPVLESVAWY